MQPSFEDDLVRHERFLLRLARRLGTGEAEPEDLVQEAFVRALERPPEERGSLRAWLATVLRRSAGRAARGGRRRTRRERAAARPEAAEDGRAIDARLDAHAEFLAHLRSLSDGERRVLFLRYSEDLAPPAIAARLGLPLDTVKTRLRRGRERLRARLDARHGDRAAWLALLVPAPARPSCAPEVPQVPQAPQAPQVIGTGLVMGATVKATLGALACAGAVLVVWLRSEHAPGGPSGAALPPAAQELRAPDLAPVTVASARASEEPVPGATLQFLGAAEPGANPGTAVAAPAAAASWPLLVRTAGDAGPGAAVTVMARLDAFARYDAAPVEGVLDGAGEARFDLGQHLSDLVAHAGGARPEELIVRIEHPDLVSAEGSLILPDPLDPARPPAEPLALLLRLERAAVVTGRLVDETGAPPEGEKLVEVHARRGDAPDRLSAVGADPAEDGTFRLRVDGEGPYVLCALGLGRRPATVPLALARGTVTDVGDVLVPKGLALEGRAVGASGAPAPEGSVAARLLDAEADAEAYCFPFYLPRELAWRAERFELRVPEVEVGEDGAFRIDGLGPGRYRIERRSTEEAAPFELPAQEVEAGTTVLVRPQGALLELRLALPAGSAGEGRIVWTMGEERAVTDVSAERAASGVLRYALPPRAIIGLDVTLGDSAPVHLAVETPEVGETLARTVAPAPARAPARLVLLLRGAPVAEDTPFIALLRGDGRETDRSLRARAGELVLDDLPPGPLRMTLSAGQDRFAPQEHLCDVELALDLAPGEERRLELALERGGALQLEARSPAGDRVDAHCTVLDSAGEPLHLVFVARFPSGRVAGPNYLFASGPARAVPELPPGLYRVLIRSPGYEPEELELAVVAGTTTERSIALRAAR